MMQESHGAKIDGRLLAGQILDSLTPQVANLKKQGIIPTLAVILVGDDPASLSFIKQKRLAAEKIGAKLTLDQLSSSTPTKVLRDLIKKYNEDPNIYGVIIQRPLPKESPVDRSVLSTVNPQKDVDGFVPNSPYNAPVAEAVVAILESIHEIPKNIVVVGRGETAGTPITKLLVKLGRVPTIIHSKTPNPNSVIKQADIVISCVGRDRIITAQNIKPGAVLIGVGMHRGEDGKLHGDYREDEIEGIVSYYTPTPGGVGPVNVSCLMKNLVKACTLQKGGKS